MCVLRQYLPLNSVINIHFVAPSGHPRSLKTKPVSSSSIMLSWDPPLLHERNGIITSYTVYLNVDDITKEYTTANTTLTVVDLLPFTTYTFSIAASTIIGQGPSSPQIMEITSEDGNSPIINIL